MAEKVPDRVEGFLIPTLEAKIRPIVAEEFAKLQKEMDEKFEGIEARFDDLDSRKLQVTGRRGLL